MTFYINNIKLLKSINVLGQFDVLKINVRVLKNVYSHAIFESKLLSAIAKACRAHIGKL